jgi:hypothetical protein
MQKKNITLTLCSHSEYLKLMTLELNMKLMPLEQDLRDTHAIRAGSERHVGMKLMPLELNKGFETRGLGPTCEPT